MRQAGQLIRRKLPRKRQLLEKEELLRRGERKGVAKKIALWAGIGASIVAIVLFFNELNSNIAKAEDIRVIQQSIKQLNTRLEYKILSDQARELQRRMWDMEERYGSPNAHDMPEYKCLKNDRGEILIQMKKIEKGVYD